MGKKGRPKSVAVNARCPDHPDSDIVANGSRTTSRGVVRRFVCRPQFGDRHSFTVLVEPTDSAVEARWSPPPPCPRHDGSKVVRAGIYGRALSRPRQRYRCTPADGSKPHVFTPPLPRDHVHEGAEHCEHCDELRGVHRGETAVARRHSWSTRIVARGLDQLSAGGSYAEVSLWALRVTGMNRTRRKPEEEEDGDDSTASTDDTAASTGGPGVSDEVPDTSELGAGDGTNDAADQSAAAPKKPRKVSAATRASRNAWHIAADWVEAFSPVVYSPLRDELVARALAERARLDALIDSGAALERPQVVLVDDVPVYGRDLERKKRSRRDTGYYVLAAAELVWPDQPTGNDDPLVVDDDPTVRLRLVRAMAKSNTDAWRLLFDELGYAPDFVIADAGTGIAAAVEAHFDPDRTRFIPSLWHVGEAVKLALADTPGAFVSTPSGKALMEPLDKHLRRLSRHSGVLADEAAWTAWWDDLEDLLSTHQLPREKVRKRRGNYEPAMAAVLDAIAGQPGVPVSTGGLETLIAKRVKPVMALRRTSFANIERTNLLFDLVVARQHGAFDDLGAVASLLRSDAVEHDGWTVPLRSVSDPRPRGGTYSSIRDATLLNTLAKQRGVA